MKVRLRRGPMVVSIFTAAAVCLSAGGAVAYDRVWAKVGATEAGMEADDAACQKGAAHVPLQFNTVAYGNPIGAAIGAGIVAGIQRAQAQNAFMKRCMKKAGYTEVHFADEEMKTLATAKSKDAKRAWLDKFYAGDMALRIEVAKRGVVPPLPDAVEEPFAIGGLKINPAALKPAADPVGAGEAALTGQAGHRRTGRLVHAVEVAGVSHPRADANTIFHEVVYAAADDPARTYWCGMMLRKPLVGPETDLDCVSTNEKGYLLQQSAGEPWLASVPAKWTPFFWKDSTADFSIAESQDDLLGPVPFSLIVKRLTRSGVALSAEAATGGKTVVFWTGTVTFGPDGKAILPFWTHRLVFTRADDKVLVALAADGQGKGWDDPAGPG